MTVQTRLFQTSSAPVRDLPRRRRQESVQLRIRKLSATGDRGSATTNERRAAELLLGKLKAAGIDATKEAFSGSRSLGARLLVHVVFAALSLAFLNWLPAVAALMAALALASIIAEQMTWGVWLSRFLCRARSYNVEGRIPARNEAARRLVLCAHYDTQQTAWLWELCRWLAPIWARYPSVLKPPLLILGFLLAGNVACAVLALSALFGDQLRKVRIHRTAGTL